MQCGAALCFLKRPKGRKGSQPCSRKAPRVHVADLKGLIRTIPDFPMAGILFRDITPLIKDPEGFRATIDLLYERFKDERIEVVVGIEARGYILAAPLAIKLGTGFVPVRKPGKLPGSKMTEEYALEYGTNSLEIHDDAVARGKRVLIVDDVLATGGTAAATGRLVERLGAEIVEFGFLIELEALGGRKALGKHRVSSLLQY